MVQKYLLAGRVDSERSPEHHTDARITPIMCFLVLAKWTFFDAIFSRPSGAIFWLNQRFLTNHSILSAAGENVGFVMSLRWFCFDFWWVFLKFPKKPWTYYFSDDYFLIVDEKMWIFSFQTKKHCSCRIARVWIPHRTARNHRLSYFRSPNRDVFKQELISTSCESQGSQHFSLGGVMPMIQPDARGKAYTLQISYDCT